MSLAIQIQQNGGPEVMQVVDVAVGEPGPMRESPGRPVPKCHSVVKATGVTLE